MFTRTIEYVSGGLLDALSKNRSSGVLKEIEGSKIQCIDDSIGLQKRDFFK